MFKIGDFSRLAHVTVKTLRHYGRLGLLKPAWIDRFTGYRYYTLEQLPRLNRILALKDLGFSLEQVSTLLRDDLSAGRLRAMLAERQRDLHAHLLDEEARLAQVEARLRQIEQEGRMTEYEVVVKPVEAQAIVSAREVVASAALMPEACARLRRSAAACAEGRSLKLLGPWFAITYNLEYAERDIDVELGVIVDELPPPAATPLPGAVAARQLPGGSMASVLHAGDLAAISQAYAALYRWVAANGYRICGPCLELYLSETPGDARLTEIQYPVERAAGKSHPTHQTVHAPKEPEMKPTLLTRPAFMVVGTSYTGKNQANEIPQMWDGQFLPRMDEVHDAIPGDTYGVCIMRPDLPEGEFEYVAALAVTRVESLPAGMVARLIPEQRYAVFTHHGPLSGLMQTYADITQKWLPAAGLEHSGGMELEVYNQARFKDGGADSEMDVYIPIK